MRRWAAIILVLEGLLLVVAIAIFLAGESDDVETPVSVPIAAAVARPPKVSVPVSVNLKTVGHVVTAAFKARGGQATTVGHEAGSLVGRSAQRPRP
jgi:hypothetical protein